MTYPKRNYNAILQWYMSKYTNRVMILTGSKLIKWFVGIGDPAARTILPFAADRGSPPEFYG